MKTTFQKTLVAVAAGSVLAIASQSAMAAANLLPAIKVGGGWISVVSYINTQAPVAGGVSVHTTHQSKDMTQTDAACVHLDGRSATTLNDLTTSVLATPGGAVGGVFPAADNVGGVLINPAALAVAASEGFMVLENYNGAGVTGDLGTLTTDALVFNLASGFLYSNRGLEVSMVGLGVAPNSDVSIEAPGAGNRGLNTVTATGPNNSLNTFNIANNTGRGLQVAAAAGGVAADGVLTRFAFLPPAMPASTGAYVIPTNRRLNVAGAGAGADDPLTTNLTAAGYRARAIFSARMDLAQSFALGIYDRLESNRSLSITNPITCVGQLSPAQITGSAIPSFIANGGWFNLSTAALTNAAGSLNLSDSATAYKVEFAAGYGLSVTPLNQQFYAK